ncbi:MAG TPA: S8 family serine peptidase [Candidatus Dormibacteraeota bacterium]|nr:S8 family serine peptidase [Candidatus Dormibacteraeota bacterium]
MRRQIWLLGTLLAFLWVVPATADSRFIVRTGLSAQGLLQLCPVPGKCTILVLDGPLNQLLLLTTPSIVDQTVFLTTLRNTPGILSAEADQLVSMVGGLNRVTTVPAGLSDRTLITYFGASVWNGYANQPAARIVRVSGAHGLGFSGTGIVADIDTGVDPNHPALKSVLLPGFDFTRNQPGGSELADFSYPAPAPCSSCQPAIVNQSSAAILDQSSAAILDGKAQYAAFGHGTMVMGVIHLVAPKAQLMPLKAFGSDGTGFLSDILRAIYFAVQNGARVINMSFDFKTNSPELTAALDYASRLSVISAASSGNDGKQMPPNPPVYPAALSSTVMGIASTGDLDARSSFSNFGDAIVWAAAPGEAIITTYPFSTYSAGWGTSFSAPFVSGTASLLLDKRANSTQVEAAAAVAHALPIGPGMGKGRLDIVQALQALTAGGTPDFSVSAAPSAATIAAGQSANYTIRVAPSGAFHQTVTLGCSGAPAAATCTISPSSVTLDGTDSATVTVSVMTTARSVLPSAPGGRFTPPVFPLFTKICLAWLLVCVLVYKSNRASRHGIGLSAAITLLVAVLFACGAGCGGGSYGPYVPPSITGTPAGTSTITITGTSTAASHATTVNLIVN